MSHLGQMRACGGGIATPAATRSRVAMTGRDTARQAAPDAIEGLRPGGAAPCDPMSGGTGASRKVNSSYSGFVAARGGPETITPADCRLFQNGA